MNVLCKCRHILQAFTNITTVPNHLRIAKSLVSDKNIYPNPKLNLSTMGNSTDFEVLPSPIQSESDPKQYKVIRLANGLVACLISDTSSGGPTVEGSEVEEMSGESDYDSSSSSDGSEEGSSDGSGSTCSERDSRRRGGAPEQKMAAAGLCIGVGSFSDPKQVPGMAHFLEHMVFMGSEKFPEENDFDSFIKKGGGSNNASTDMEMTTFYFECLEKHLRLGLDKFAQFFISPLMKKSAMTREREAIESEFQMALPSDGSRKEQLLLSFAKPDSPVNSFSWGNLITLRDNISNSKLYKGVHEFRKRHYSAHRMTLAIQAMLPIDTLQTYVLECFSNVPNNSLPPENYSRFAGTAFDTPDFSKIYYVRPIKDQHRLDLTWKLPPLLDKYKCNPTSYLSHLLGDEGQNSLTSYLRKKLWVISVTSDNSESGSDYNSIYALFSLNITLTNNGLDHLNEVIEAVFSYINLLKKVGPQERIFNELKSVADIGFKFAMEEPPVDFVEDLCECMQQFPPEHYITGTELLYEYDPKLIAHITNYFTPENTNVMVLSKTLPGDLTYTKQEPWFGTEYTDTEMPKEWIKKWSEVAPYPELDLPPPNIYLTEDFSILPESSGVHPEYPEKILNTPLMEAWYRKDQKFKLPVAHYYIYLVSPLCMESAANAAMIDIMMGLIMFCSAEELYPAACADLSFVVMAQEKGVVFKIYGFNEKLPLILDVLTKYLTSLENYMSREIFENIKTKLEHSYHNTFIKPSNLAKDVRLELLVNSYWSCLKKYKVLHDISFEDFGKFLKDYLESIYIKALVQGNVSKEVAIEAISKLATDLKSKPIPEGRYPLFRVGQVPTGEKCLRIKGFNEKDPNTIVTNYYQHGPFNLKASATIDLIMQIIEEPLFNILRTQEQLGYHVTCALRDTFGILGYTITVNSQVTKFTSTHLDSRIEEFLKSTHQLLQEMTSDELCQIKEDLIKTKSCLDVHLKEEVDRNWLEIVSEDYMFDRSKAEIESIKKVSIEEIREWWSQHNMGQEKFRKISFQVIGHDAKDQDATANKAANDNDVKFDTLKIIGNETTSDEGKGNEYFIQDIEQYKSNVYVYPPVIETKA